MPKPRSKGANGTESNKPAEPSGELTKFQSFTTETVHRSRLKGADYNPRQITEEAKFRLREAMREVGLVQPIVWNKRSGNIVGGHQRLRQLDSLEGRPDYLLTVAVIDVDDVREREINVLLNNPEVCGDWDLAKLQDVLDFEGLEVANAGFDAADVLRMFGEAAIQHQGGDSAAKDEANAALGTIKNAYGKLAEACAPKDDTDFYMVVIFRGYDDRKAFTDRLGLIDNRYVDGRVLVALLDVKKPEPSAQRSEGENPGAGQHEPELPAEPAGGG